MDEHMKAIIACLILMASGIACYFLAREIFLASQRGLRKAFFLAYLFSRESALHLLDLLFRLLIILSQRKNRSGKRASIIARLSLAIMAIISLGLIGLAHIERGARNRLSAAKKGNALERAFFALAIILLACGFFTCAIYLLGPMILLGLGERRIQAARTGAKKAGQP